MPYKLTEDRKKYQAHYKRTSPIYKANQRAYQYTPHRRYRNFYNKMSKRTVVELSFEQWNCISSLPCSYCQGAFDTQKTSGSHIDRQDNAIGYTLTNAISCCAFCNGIKSDRLTYQETVVVIGALLAYRNMRLLSDEECNLVNDHT